MTSVEISLQDLEDTINAVPSGVAVLLVEPDNRFVLQAVNAAAKAMFLSDDNPVGRTLQEWKFPPDIINRIQDNCETVVRERRPVYRERPFTLRDDTVIWIGSTSTPMLNADGEVTQILLSTIDVTDLVVARKGRERELVSVASGFVRMCAWCSSISDERAGWIGVDDYIDANPGRQTPINVCDSCRDQG